MEKLLEILFISSLKGVGKKTIHKQYFEAIKSCEDINDLEENLLPKIKAFSTIELKTAEDNAKKRFEEILNKPDIMAITYFDSCYPVSVKALQASAPLILYTKGNAELLGGNNIAVVGTRKPSDHTAAVEQNLVKKIIDLSNTTIVSGLAVGCDYIAHDTAVKQKGCTIAAMPSGVENVIPAQNRLLADKIVSSGGCLVSEYQLNAPATKWTYVERDSLIAALSETTIVAECGVNSGTMHTVKAAMGLRRKIACYIPEDFAKGKYDGNLYMVDNLGAVPLKNTEDLRKLLS